MGTLDNSYPQYSYPIMVSDDAAYNSSGGPGGGIGFSFKQTSGGAYAQAGGIRGIKENTTDGDYGSCLLFYTRRNGEGASEQLRITSRAQLMLGGGLGGTKNRDFTHLFDMHPLSNPAGALWNYQNGNLYLGQNIYFTGQYQRDQAAASSYLWQGAGSFSFNSAASGSAGAATTPYKLMGIEPNNLSTSLSTSNRPSVKGNLVLFGNSSASTNGGIEFHTSGGGGGGYGGRITCDTDGKVQIHTRNNNAGWSTKFTVSGTASEAQASNFGTGGYYRSSGPGGGAGIKMMGLAAGSGNNAVDTGISINASNGGRTMLVLGSRNTGAGSSTDSYLWLLRFNYDGNNLPSEYNITGDSSFWSVSKSGSNTLVLNGNSGNWQFGGIWVN